MAEILILEPNRRTARRIAECLARIGHSPVTVGSVREAELSLGDRRMMAILSTRLPFAQCSRFLQSLQARGLPALFIAGDAANADHLKAMYRGTCQVILHSFTMPQLIRAVEQLIQDRERTLSLGSLRLDTETRRVTKDGEVLDLTTQEFELLQALMRSPDEAVSREELLRTAWGYQCMGITRTVDVHVQRLRRKLGAAAIETVYKTGYRLRPA